MAVGEDGDGEEEPARSAPRDGALMQAARMARARNWQG